MPLRPCTNEEWSTLPHVMLTSDLDWDPTCDDFKGHLDNEERFGAQSSFPNGTNSKLFNDHGENSNVHDYHELQFVDAQTFKEDTLDCGIVSFLSCNNASTTRKEPKYGSLQPLFNWLSINLIKNAFEISTQHARTHAFSLLKKTYHSPFPEFNAKRWYGPVATDIMHSCTPVVDGGSTFAQIFVTHSCIGYFLMIGWAHTREH